ncbi:c-type cytochrome domain-containing protein [Muriicola sp. Z0-33]|uniref:c-type cytochrome domain-containing protein n=1 Tax=Muriicola sp. Z0-33 TaxID=2816957 RepID=UPI002237AA83|nr:c-type cytochrome domain-containing protein [Muriicola sp. Z0-33]MCW5517908.1 hypothetical protein [Muriicola sp. Z0-33]
MEVLKQLIGRLHPVIVHLPIGFILAGLLLQWVDRNKKDFVKITALLFMWAAIAGLVACVTGYLQYLGEGYSFKNIKTHLWLGIVTTIVVFALYLRLSENLKFPLLKKLPETFLSLLLLLLISYTGHLGGSITHGDDYLIAPLPNNIKSALGFETYEVKPIELSPESWEEAQFYDDIIAPILNNNCVSCHNKKRAKGELVLNSEEAILKGGENGDVLIPNNVEESAIYSRLILPDHDEDHMPPKDKKQPDKEEIALIKTWILNDAPFDKSIGEMGLQKSLFTSFFPKKANEDYPDVEVVEASLDSINTIKKQGIHVQRISTSSNFLSVSCINRSDFSDKDFIKLSPIRQQIVDLDLGRTKISDAVFEQIALLPNLTVLKIDYTSITGQEMHKLHALEHLKVLNLTGSNFKKVYLEQLYGFKGLKSVFLAYTGLDAADNRENNDKTTLKIEFGNYELPFIESDSIIY